MGYFLGTSSYSTTGTKTVTVPFTPKQLRISVGKKGSTDTTARRSVGDYCLDTDVQVCDTFYSDTTGSKTDRTNTMVNLQNRVSGNIVAATTARVDQVNAPWTSTQVKFIIDLADVNAQYKIEIWD